MKIKNGDIQALKPALENILRLPANQLSWKGKYFLAKLGRVISGPLQDIEAARVKLVQEYGQKTEQGFSVPPKKAAAFQVEFAKVLDIEVEVEWSLATLTEKDADALTGGEMMLLDQFITFPDPSTTPSDGVIPFSEAEKIVQATNG